MDEKFLHTFGLNFRRISPALGWTCVPWAVSNGPDAARAIDEFLGDLKHQIQFDESANRYYIFKE